MTDDEVYAVLIKDFQKFPCDFDAAVKEINDKFSRALEPLTALSLSLEKSDFEKDVSE